MATWSLSVSVRCAGCGVQRGLDQFRGMSERLIMSGAGVLVHLMDERVKCPECGDRRVRVRFGSAAAGRGATASWKPF